jgi:iron complex transport system permease protein
VKPLLAFVQRLDRWRTRPRFWSLVLGSSVVVAAIGASGVGAARLPVAELSNALSDPHHPGHAVLWDVRMPRIMGAIVVGAALGVAGALMQAIIRNPLADPGLLGVTAGAGLGGLVAIIGAPERPALVPILAFVGGLAAVATVLVVSWSSRRVVTPLRLVLTGVAVQAVLFSMIALLTFAFADRAPAFAAFTIGSLSGLGWHDLARVLPPAAIGVGLAIASTRTLDLLLLDDDSAAGVGLRVWRARTAMSVIAALLAAAAAGVAGLVGFVGLVVPNWVRVLVGPGHRALLPLSAIGGALLLVCADTAARTLVAPLELPVGALLALVGGPYFLFVLWRRLP